jgi:hypothetical protein
MKKLCRKCNTKKEAIDFYKDNLNKADGLRHECKECVRKRVLKRYQLKPEEIKEYNRQYRKLNKVKLLKQKRMRRLGISSEEHDFIVERAQGLCEICGKHQEDFPYSKLTVENGELSIDHNHTTGELRGLLCANCNHGLGKLSDSGIKLIQAIKYLSERDKSFRFSVHEEKDGAILIVPNK